VFSYKLGVAIGRLYPAGDRIKIEFGPVQRGLKAISHFGQLVGSGNCLASQGVRVRTYVAVRWAPLR
jgi:hypothetical protein